MARGIYYKSPGDIMDIKALRYFVELVNQQSFTRASEQLFVTQPTISKMIRSLEQEIEQPLLHREGRRFWLTDAGEVVYDHFNSFSNFFNFRHLHFFNIPEPCFFVNKSSVIRHKG